MAASSSSSSSSSSANLPLRDGGKTYHMLCGHGDVANRILTVGSHGRAKMLSQFLDEVKVEITSPRGFSTYTGLYRGVPVSVVAVGMGYPMVDFLVRETKFICEGDLAIIRFGTCGVMRDGVDLGTICLASAASMVQMNFDHWDKTSPPNSEPYHISKLSFPDPSLHQQLEERMTATFGPLLVASGTDISGDTFYSSEGRLSDHFDDQNEDLIAKLQSKYPDALALEMETALLFHLSKMSRFELKTAGCAVGIAQRKTNEMISPEKLTEAEKRAAIPLLDTLVSCPLAHWQEKGAWGVYKGEAPVGTS